MPHARHTDPTTSHEAAGSVTGLSTTMKNILFMFESYGPMSDEELARMWALRVARFISDSGLRSRRSELVALGYIKDSGARARTRSGRSTIVWAVA